MNDEQVTLANIGGGAAMELFHAELQRCLENIQDVNTDPEAKRTITITVQLSPDEKRARIDATIKAKSSLAALKPAEALIYVARVKGQHIAKEMRREQIEFPTSQPATFPAAVSAATKE